MKKQKNSGIPEGTRKGLAAAGADEKAFPSRGYRREEAGLE